MKAISPFSVSVIALLGFIGCSSKESSVPDPQNTAQTENQTAEPPVRPNLPPRDQYVSDARALVDEMIEIVSQVKDSATAAEALEACSKLKPTAQKLGETASKMIKEVRDDPAARDELVKFFQTKCHSDAELKPLISVLGESEKQSSYPELLKTVGELLEIAMYNYF